MDEHKMYKLIFRTDRDDTEGRNTNYLYSIHEKVKLIFPEKFEDRRETFRVDDGVVSIYGHCLPQNTVHGTLTTAKTWYPEGAELGFRMRANPLSKTPEGEKVAKDSFEASDWIHAKASKKGFEVLTMSVIMEGVIWVTKKDGKEYPNVTVSYEGRLRVTEPVLFESALLRGVGREKYLGYGMLEIYE